MIAVALLGGLALKMYADNEKTTIRGWLADDGCARNRASSGKYTMTSLTCAKECVSKGKKIALVDAEGKRVLAVTNQEAVAKNLGTMLRLPENWARREKPFTPIH
jgi:hypothetical protein